MVLHTLRVGGKGISAVGVMTTGGIEDAYIVEGGVNGDVFETFVRRSLLPILQPFNGSNPCSVVILDNASIHHLEQIEDTITGVGALIRFMCHHVQACPKIHFVVSKELLFGAKQ